MGEYDRDPMPRSGERSDGTPSRPLEGAAHDMRLQLRNHWPAALLCARASHANDRVVWMDPVVPDRLVFELGEGLHDIANEDGRVQLQFARPVPPL